MEVQPLRSKCTPSWLDTKGRCFYGQAKHPTYPALSTLYRVLTFGISPYGKGITMI